MIRRRAEEYNKKKSEKGSVWITAPYRIAVSHLFVYFFRDTAVAHRESMGRQPRDDEVGTCLRETLCNMCCRRSITMRKAVKVFFSL